LDTVRLARGLDGGLTDNEASLMLEGEGELIPATEAAEAGD